MTDKTEQVPEGEEATKITEGVTLGVMENTFSQAQVDAIIKDRLARKDKQFADYDDIKAKADEFDKIEEANKTELEKAQAEIASTRAEADAAIAEAKETVLRSTVIARAAAIGFQDPADAYALIDKTELTEDGIDELLKELAEKKPYMLGKTKPPKLPANNPGANARSEGEDAEARRRRLLG